MRRHKVVVSRHARRMIEESVYFLRQVSPDAARKLRDEIMSDIRGLEQMPERFPYLSLDGKDGYRKMVVAGRYFVLYLLIHDTVYVEHVIDGRQNYEYLLQ